MPRDFDLFERRRDGTLNYRGLVHGIEQARVQVRLLATETDHECFAICALTHDIVARILPVTSDSKRLFQIAYDARLLDIRAELLRSWGYHVTSAFGNDEAKRLLQAKPAIDLFLIGHIAPEEVRLEMVHWLRQQYAQAKILALNPPDTQRLGNLQYNALFSAPDLWLPLVAAATSDVARAPGKQQSGDDAQSA